MNKAFRFQDEKSDKFWRVETLGCEMVTNWGKTATFGRWQITEFDTEENCEKEAAKLIASKIKKGYQPMDDLDLNTLAYFDTEDFGPHPLTSHPIFRKYFSDELYYSCGDEDAPFGSDEGSDTLAVLEATFRKRPNMDFTDFPRKLIEDEWQMDYLSPADAQTDEQLKSLEGDMLQTDQVIIATAFGQIKITGGIDPAVFELALKSLDRMEKLYPDVSSTVSIMRRDLEEFARDFNIK